MNDAARHTPDTPRGHRFDGVLVDRVARRLVVDGRERAASRRAFDLLVILCESPGRVLSRQVLSDALWPGGQVVSDEALTQAIFRVRAALGQHAERVVTIRGVGIRFDADVRAMGDDATSATPPASLAGDASVAMARASVSAGAADVVAMPIASPARAAARDAVAPAARAGRDAPAAPLSPSTSIPDDEIATDAPARAPGSPAVPGVDTSTIAGPVHATPGIELPSSTRASRDPAAVDAPASAAGHGAATRPVIAVAPRRRVAAIALAAIAVLAVLAIALGLAWRGGPSPDGASIDEGYQLRAADVHASAPETVPLLREALRHENTGDRPRARALLEALHERDARTPVPALLLGLWRVGAGDGDAAARWTALARDRIAPLHDPYLATFLRYVEAEVATNADDVIRYAGALLDLRPGAWRMRHARAHLYWVQGMREAALREIAQVEVRSLGDRKLEAVLADRASFGDVAGARAALARLPRDDADPAYAFLEGRIAWSAGDVALARAAFERAAATARVTARIDIRNRATANAGVAALAHGDAEAATAYFERARAEMIESGWKRDEIDMSLLLAQLGARRGDAAAARAEFARAVAVLPAATIGYIDVMTLLIGARVAPEVPVSLARPPGPEAEALIAARRALAAGDRDAARTAFVAARSRGVFESNLVDEARLVGAELGEAVPPARPFDPLYPPFAIMATRLAVDDVLAKR